ncbi:MAG: Trm112 family protein [Desulfurococcaceae archaeon]
MRYWGMDFLKCIYCKSFPLQLIPLNTVNQEIDTSGFEKPICKFYCAYLNEKIEKNRDYPCFDCLKIEIIEAVMYCKNCGRWYPVRNSIIQILKDSKRDRKKDLEFLNKWRDKLPDEITLKGKPFNLSGEGKSC